jgi:large subunit ribosomal protein L3
MSEANTETQTEETKPEVVKAEGCQLDSIYAFKKGMTSYFTDAGESVAATVLKYEPLVISQVKTKEKDGYTAVQVSFMPKKSVRTAKSEKNHLKASGFENGAYHAREIRQDLPETAQVGTKVSLDSLKVGDLVKVTSRSKGRGFAGVVRRWGMAGGPETHGSGFHRRPGSIGNRTWPGRVMPGKKFPGHYGDETVTVKNLRVLDIIADENVIVVSGAIPGAENTLVQLTKV